MADHSAQNTRDRLLEAVHHFEHVLPGQAPIKDFVHHNTLHGFQHLTFTEAVAEAERITGSRGYLPLETSRELYRTGRIDLDDLIKVLNTAEHLAPEQDIGIGLKRYDILLTALIVPITKLTGCQLSWQIEELNGLTSFQSDVPTEQRETLLSKSRQEGCDTEADAISALWSGCLKALDLEFNMLHPEELMDLSPEQAEMMMQRISSSRNPDIGPRAAVKRLAAKDIEHLISRVGPELTLRDLLLHLSGRDLLEDVRPHLIRYVSNFLDQGLASWHSEHRNGGFYSSWRQDARFDLSGLFNDLPEWSEEISILDEDPMETLILELQRLQLPENVWPDYIERLALELPGWSGMFYWHSQNPGYRDLPDVKVDMIDYLAVRMVLDRLYAQRICREFWQVAPSLDMLRWYFRNHRAEFMVRDYLYNRHLPEYLSSLAQRLAASTAHENTDEEPWQHLADMIWTWSHSPSADNPTGYSVYRHGWQLFRLCQHLAIGAAEIRRLKPDQISALFECLDDLTEDHAAFIWLQAYENHYRDEVFNAIAANEGRGLWKQRTQRPMAQIVWCMDEREEGIRRHLEVINPMIETFGAAAHFNVPHNWRGLDDDQVTGLCPVVMKPTHEIDELPREGNEQEALSRRHKLARLAVMSEYFNQESRRNLFLSMLIQVIAAPLSLLHLLGKSWAPGYLSRLSHNLLHSWLNFVPTKLALDAASDAPEGTIEINRMGFSLLEQTDRLEVFLRNIGLISGFSRLTIIMGHGSTSENNPHRAAYDCGACSGRHSGPNARILAAIGNNGKVRGMLAERGIEIPTDVWFVGAFHNTCSEQIDWYDTDLIPLDLQGQFEQVRGDVLTASMHSAHERCRKFHSAPKAPTLPKAAQHIASRADDFSQARPELGHATNACAVIGRRSITQGAFFDRRAFLISYDPTTDPSGEVLERLLLANGPVGAGINLEYYFSAVNNEQYGCGTKILHNITGLYGVMEGASSDLRTGLPRQMIEVHEPMRLQVIVEAKTELLTEIYIRQPPLQELIGNGWLLVSAKDPDSARIDVFDPAKGWIEWLPDGEALPTVNESVDWYQGKMDPISPVLLTQPEISPHA